jgi:hypothetical protein
MKKITIVALSIVALASLTGVAYANGDDAPPDVLSSARPQVVAPKKSKHIKKQPVAASEKGDQAKKQPQTEKQQAAPQIDSSKKDEVQGRGLPKAFSGSEEDK